MVRPPAPARPAPTLRMPAPRMPAVRMPALPAPTLLVPALLSALASLAAAPTRADWADAGVAWRPYSGAAFREAGETGRPVFLVLTAPWTWDHFLLPDRVFRDPDVQQLLAADWVPVLADAEAYPELREAWSIPSGLLPSFHFLDADGTPFASAAPLPPDVLALRLQQWRDPTARPAPEPAPGGPAMAIVGSFAGQAAQRLIELSERGDLPVAPVHRDVDPGALLFLAEVAMPDLPRRSAETISRELFPLRTGPLADPVDGGFHRAYAIVDSMPHHEKTLRGNLRLGRLLCLQFIRTQSLPVGAEALGVLRFLNEKLRDAVDPIYAASLAADVFDPTRRELVETGGGHYAKRDPEARAADVPPRSGTVPAGGNFAAMSTFATYAAVFGDDRILDAVRRAGPRLMREGLEDDGRARRILAAPGPGNLIDQAEAGRGLLAIHALTGSAAALAAAERVAEALVAHHGDGGVFRSVADDADVPRFVRDRPPDPAWNGEALRFLVELAAVTRERAWLERARDGVAVWKDRAPADGRGLGELAGAAYRLDEPPAVFLLRADPGEDEGRRLLAAALSVHSPVLRIRWVAPGDVAGTARRFGVRFEDEPALYLVRDRPSGALRDPDVVRAVWRESARDAAE